MISHTLRMLPRLKPRKNSKSVGQQVCTCYTNRSWRYYSQPTLQIRPDESKTVSSINNDVNTTKKQVAAAVNKVLEATAQYSLKGHTVTKHMRALANDLRQKGIPLTSEVYDGLLYAYFRVNARHWVLPLLNEMQQNNVPPTLSIIEKSLKMAVAPGDAILQSRILEKMDYFGIQRTVSVYGYLVDCMKTNQEFERALDTLDEMKRHNIIPTARIYMIIVSMAIQFNEPAIAFSLLEEADKVEQVTDRFQYASALRLAVLYHHHDLVKKYWAIVTKKMGFLPDDGLCKSALLVAARFSDPQLAYDIFYAVSEAGYPYTDHHFACLLESFASTQDMKNTFRVFTKMRQAGIVPSKSTSVPVARHLGNDTNAIFKARDALLDLRKENNNTGQVDVAAFNVIIHTFAYNGMFDESLTTFNMAKHLGVTPDGDTLDALLDACIHQRNATQGEVIYRSFIQSGLQPSVTSLSKMVTLMCTQDDFEDAFLYLEQIKKLGHAPLRGAYYRLIKKLSASNDPRLDIAVEDMEACGYSLSTHLDDYIDDKAYLHEKRAKRRNQWLLSDNR